MKDIQLILLQDIIKNFEGERRKQIKLINFPERRKVAQIKIQNIERNIVHAMSQIDSRLSKSK